MTTEYLPSIAAHDAEIEAELFTLGGRLTKPELRSRFAGVQQNIVQEMHCGLCSVDQARVYLMNFENWLLSEQDREVNVLAAA